MSGKKKVSYFDPCLTWALNFLDKNQKLKYVWPFSGQHGKIFELFLVRKFYV